MRKSLGLWMIVTAAMLLLTVPAALAQEIGDNTITVVGSGSATASPDMATVEIGVELADEDVSAAYAQVNQTLDGMMQALIATGISNEDVQTVGINVFTENMGMGPDGSNQTRFRVSNRLRVTVRNLDLVENVIDTAVNNGANTIYGLQFAISNPDTLEAEARTAALDDARQNAQQIADYLGVTLSEIVRVSEADNGFAPMPQRGLGGGGGIMIEPGSASVPVSLEVTYRFNR